MSILANAISTPVPPNGNPEPEPFCGLLAFARQLHAYRIQHDQIRLEAARIRLQEEEAYSR
jgi:hypothetical protein